MKVETRTEIVLMHEPEDGLDSVSEIYVYVECDGRKCGHVAVGKGYTKDIEKYVAGEIDADEMHKRWNKMRLDAIRALENAPPDEFDFD